MSQLLLEREQEFEDYVIEEELGKGGEGTVYKAKNKKTNERVSLKIAKEPVKKTKAEIAQETKPLTDLSDKLNHPNIVKIQKAGIFKKRPFLEQLFEKGMCVFESILFGKWLYDINAQPNMFHRHFFEQWASPPGHFGLDLYAYIQAKTRNLHIIKFPVLFPERIHGESHFHTNALGKVKVAKKVIKYSRELKQNLQA